MLENSKASGFPKFFYARHMRPGLCGYHNETVLVDDTAIQSMLPTFVGKPIYIHHRDVNIETLKQDAAGYVVDSFWNEMDGWAWVKMMVGDDDALEAIQNQWSVSNAYIPQEFGGPGTLHNVPYNRGMKNGMFTHLAITPDPRYEDAKIFTPEEFKRYQVEKQGQLYALKNSKTEPKKGSVMLEFFKTKREKVNEVDADTSIELTNSKGEKVSVTVAEMAAAVEAHQEKQNAKAQTVKVGGKDMAVDELVKQFTALQNSGDGEKAEDSKKEDEKSEKAEDSKKEDEKQNSGENGKHFEEMKNAHLNADTPTPIATMANKQARGKSLYGKVE